jgi:hypothetical protein
MAEDAPTRADEVTKPADENPSADATVVVADAPASEEKGADVAADSSDKKASEGDEEKPASSPEEAEKANGAEEPAEGESVAAAETAPAATPAKTPGKKGKATPKMSKKKSQANLKKKSAAETADIKYEVGQHVIAKMRGFPPWPAIILSKELLPEMMLKKPAGGNAKSLESLGDAAWNAHYPILYMGTYE